jgi:glycosyltransferase involved in cell wall biosynthesis
VTTRPRIAVVSWYRPGLRNSGDRRRLGGVLDGIERSGDITLISFEPMADSPAAQDDIVSRHGIPYRYGVSTLVISMARRKSIHTVALQRPGSGTSKWLAQQLRRLEPDVVIANQLPAWSLIPPSYRAKTIVDTHNVETARLGRMMTSGAGLRRAGARLAYASADRIEREVAAEAAAVLCVSEEETDHFLRLGAKRVATVPNGFTTPELRWRFQEGPRRALFLAKLDYSANVHALSTLLSEWMPRLPSTFQLDIIGSGNPEAARRLIRSSGNTRVRLVGEVDNVSEAYTDHSMLLAPYSQGAGTRLKIVEAMAHGLPIVGTGFAVGGLNATPNIHYLPVEDPSGVAAAADAALHEGTASGVSEAAKSLVRDLEWGRAVEPAVALIRDVARSTRG